ncbi:MAG TPA: hypothetical protein PLG96_01450 [Flexilinea sp.]|nr:hypothetical protein [Flexilinea sp.]
MSSDKEKIKQIFNIFWPLAISWLFMAVDIPFVSAIVSRMPQPEINLAAHSVVYPIALIIEAPIIMMLSVSLALSKDKKNYRRIYKFMMILCAGLTIIHASISCTPLFYLVVGNLMGAPKELLPYARVEMIMMIPWTWAIGYRRFYQGILIRNGHSKQVTIGTIIRMSFLIGVLLIGYRLQDFVSGTMTAGAALSSGVIAEGLFCGLKGRKTADRDFEEGELSELISWGELIRFVIPLILTQIINLGWTSLGSAAMSRMINPIASLAVWPVLSGLLNIIKSFGSACNETTLSVINREGFYKADRRFTFYIAIFSTLFYAALIVTPLGRFWFEGLSSLTPELSDLAKKALPMIFLVPFVNTYLNFYQAILLAGKKTSGFLESLLIYLIFMISILYIGILTQKWEGIYVIMIGMNIAVLAQTLWTRFRAKKIIPLFDHPK